MGETIELPFDYGTPYWEIRPNCNKCVWHGIFFGCSYAKEHDIKCVYYAQYEVFTPICSINEAMTIKNKLGKTIFLDKAVAEKEVEKLNRREG